FPDPATIFDYLPPSCCIVLDEPQGAREGFNTELTEYRNRYNQVHEMYRVAMLPEEMFAPYETLTESPARSGRIELSDFDSENPSEELRIEFAVQTARQYHGQVQEIVQDLLRLQEQLYSTYVVIPTLGKAERLAEILAEYQAPVSLFQNVFEAEE